MLHCCWTCKPFFTTEHTPANIALIFEVSPLLLLLIVSAPVYEEFKKPDKSNFVAAESLLWKLTNASTS